MKKILFLALVLLHTVITTAQVRSLTVNSSTQNDGAVVFKTLVDGCGSYTVMLRIDYLNNMGGSRNEIISSRYSNNIYYVKLQSSNTKQQNSVIKIEYDYNYQWVAGKVDPKVNRSIVYRLPLSVQKKCQVRDLNNLQEQHLGENDAENWRSFQFIAEKGDTVYAMRKGMVVDVVDDKQVAPEKGLTYSSKVNSIIVEHDDGTLARYSVLDGEGIMVKEGDMVYPDTPIALVGTYNDEKYETRVMIYFKKLNKEKFYKGELEVISSYIDPIFATTDGNVILEKNQIYTPVLTSNMINAERLKKEIKKLKKEMK